MSIRRRLQLAAIIGVASELILLAPLFIRTGSPLLDTFPLPLRVEALKRIQKPGYPIVMRFLQIDTIRRLTARLPQDWWVHFAQALVILIQATLFTLVAMAVLALLWRFKTDLLHKRFLLALFLPPSILILIGAENGVWPVSELVSDRMAELLVTVSLLWLVIGALAVGTTLAATWKDKRHA